MEIQNHNLWEIILTLLSTCSTFMLGHNFWLAAKDESKEEIKIELLTSDRFPESDSAMKRERIRNFRVFGAAGAEEVTNYQTEGNLLFARIEDNGSALIAAIELFSHPITLAAEKFAGYIASEEAEKFVAPNFIEGETKKAQRESYVKFAKALLNHQSYAEIAGHQLEIVLQHNPSQLREKEKLKLQVLFEGQPIGNLRVSSGAENINNGKYAAHAKTDANGCAEIEIAPRGLCFLRTHFIRPSPDLERFEWESFWASFTFRI